MNEDYTLAVFSVASDDVIDLANGNGWLIPIGSMEYFDENKELKATSYGSLNRHGKDSWALDHRSLDWVSRDEMGYSKAIKAPLFKCTDRQEYQKFMFRNSGDDNYPAKDDWAHQGSTHVRDEYVHTLAKEGNMELDLRRVERVILYLNGQYWGVYGMRDRPVDHDYTSEYYNQGKYDLQYLSTWGSTTIQYGGQKAVDDWESIRDFVLENDMSIEANYKVADDSINLVSLIDYMIVNLNVVASDWLNYNTGWWRGLNPDGEHKKWGYILWDLDATFDYYINYSGVPNTDPDAVPCDLEEIADFLDQWFNYDVGQHEKIFLKLLEESETFEQLYYSRYADMMNTVFSCENMQETLSEMLAVIQPEMPAQIERWGGTMDEWEQNVKDLQEFISERCTLLDDGALSCYEELEGPYQLTLNSEPEFVSTIDLNTITIDSFPWTGDYFGGMENKISATLKDDFEFQHKFSHWVSTSGNIIDPDTLNNEANLMLFANDTLTAVFEKIEGEIDPMTVVINEFVASNDSTSTIADQNGEYDDWIEFYNNSDQDVDLSGTFLSDKGDNIFKWSFPESTIIEANGYLIVWADEDMEQDGLHTNFKLSKGGEDIYFSDVNGDEIDHVAFGEQTTNLAYARVPNGIGEFVMQEQTFNGNNDVVFTEEVTSEIEFKVFPNPASNQIYIEYKNADDSTISLFNSMGQLVLSNKLSKLNQSNRANRY